MPEKKNSPYILFLIISISLFLLGILYLYFNEYTQLSLSENTIISKGRLIRYSQASSDSYSKYIHVNNPGFYVSAKKSEEIVSYSGVFEVKDSNSTFEVFINGLSHEDLIKYSKHTAQILYDKNNNELSTIDDWWFNLWPGITLTIISIVLFSLIIFLK